VPLGIPLQAFLYSHSYLLNVTIQFANKTGVLIKKKLDMVFSSRVGDSDYELVNCGRRFPKSVSSYALPGRVEETSALARPSSKKSSFSTLLDDLHGS
jgi:hypothetical protein